MTVYYKGNPLKEFQTFEEAQTYVKLFQEAIFIKYKYFIDKANELVKKIYTLRPRMLAESIEEYEEDMKATQPILFKEIEDLGKKFYGDKYIRTYFINSETCLVGYLVITNEGKKRRESIENLGLKACTHFAFNQLFEIK